MSISYQITPLPSQHIYLVKLSFMATASTQILKLPVWVPGSYMLREFSKNITHLSAAVDDVALNLQQITKNSWRLSEIAIGSIVEVTYSIYAYEYGIRTAFLDQLRGYFNPTSLCLAISGAEADCHRVSFAQLPPGWQICSALQQISPSSFSAENYDELLDSPFELGEFCRLEFRVAGAPHYVVLSGTILTFDEARFIAEISKICAYQIELFGGVAPYTSYTFILNLSGEIYTGLEHRNSTLLMAPTIALPNLSRTNDEDYHKLMGLISHEFFHTWNVKRIKPQVFSPYDLDRENYTKLLWWFEGVTSYYDDLVLYKCGIISQEKYLNRIVESLNNVYKFAGVAKQSLANSSLTSWVKYYRQDENSPNSIVSYYVKGALVAMCLDLLIRQQSEQSLDDVMRHLYQLWQQDRQGIAEDEIPALIFAATGVDLQAFIHLATETVEMLPFSQILAKYGLELSSRQAKSHQDIGKFYPLPADLSPTNAAIDLGAKLEKQALGYLVKNVYDNTSTHAAGLAVNDIIIALNQLKLTNLEKQLAFYQAGDQVELAVFRQERLIKIKLSLSPSIAKVFDLILNDKQALANWL